MATDFQGQFLAAADINFQQRVAAALAVVAIQVYTELSTITGHVARAAYALQVVQNPPLSMVTVGQFQTMQADRLVYAWARLLASQGLDNGASDAAIQALVTADWNAMAGV